MNALAEWIRVKLRNGADPGPFRVSLENHKVVIEIDPGIAQQAGSPLMQESFCNDRPVACADLGSSTLHDVPRQNWSLYEANLRVEELADANRRKDEFLAMLSHELRSPLASIHYVMAVLARQTHSASAQERMQTLIERQLGRMNGLVDELLDVSRIASGHLHLQRERTDLRVILRNSIETIEPSIHERNQQLSTELPDTPVWLRADPRRLEQVFVNLLTNASRYTDAHGELKVWAHARNGEGIVGIRDSGVGIAADVLPHIFDLFKQGNKADPRSRAGLGVGLALVRNLVEQHGGSVSAASAGAGQGSEFTVRLPAEE